MLQQNNLYFLIQCTHYKTAFSNNLPQAILHGIGPMIRKEYWEKHLYVQKEYKMTNCIAFLVTDPKLCLW
jgi:hypothetical protein